MMIHSDLAAANHFYHFLKKTNKKKTTQPSGEHRKVADQQRDAFISDTSTAKYILLKYHLQFTAWLHICLPSAWPGRKLST